MGWQVAGGVVSSLVFVADDGAARTLRKRRLESTYENDQDKKWNASEQRVTW